MTIDLNDEEIKLLRNLLTGRWPQDEELPLFLREQIVLKLHAALEGMYSDGSLERDTGFRVH